MIPLPLKNQPRRCLVIEVNPYQTLVAAIVRPPRGGNALVEHAAAFNADDTEGPQAWIEEKWDTRRNWVPVICGFVPRQGVIHRETITGTELEDAAHRADLIRDLGGRRSSSMAPFQQAKIEDWTFRAVSALGGNALAPDAPPTPALLVALQNREIQQVQQRMLDYRLLPQRIEPALLPLFGSLYQIMAHRRQSRAAVVCVIRNRTTEVYILGKEGVHTPGIVSQGLLSVVQQARHQFNLETDAVARTRLQTADGPTRAHARKLVRGLADDIRPVLDSYEMTTGHPVGAIYCAYLPPTLTWLAEPLVRMMGHELLSVDCDEWMGLAGLERSSSVPALEPQWLGALSLVSNLPPEPSGKAEKAFGETTAFQRPWHVDSRNSNESRSPAAAARRTLQVALIATAAALALIATGWQWHVAWSLRRDAAYWDAQLTQNRAIFEQLTAASAESRSGAARIEHAHALMASPYVTSEFLMNLGRTLPARMRIDRIEGNLSRVLIGGTILEPAEEASLTLGRYMDNLRNTPEFGNRFPSITATSLHREGSNDVLAFEVTLRLPTPKS